MTNCFFDKDQHYIFSKAKGFPKISGLGYSGFRMPGLCPRCSKAVYFAEEIKTKGEVFHKLCFNCSGCKKLLEPGNFSENDGNIYCRTCYGWVSGRGLCLQLLYDFNNLAKVLDPEDMVLVAGPEFFRLRMVREEEEKRGSL